MSRLMDAGKALVELPMRALRDLVQIKDGLLDFDARGKLIGKFTSFLYSATLGAAIDALSASDPDEQISGALWMIGWSVATSLFSGGFTLLVGAFWSIFLFIGVARYSDDGEAFWKRIQPDIGMFIPGSSLLSRPKQYATRSRRGGEK